MISDLVIFTLGLAATVCLAIAATLAVGAAGGWAIAGAACAFAAWELDG